MLHDPPADAAPDQSAPGTPSPDEPDVIEWGDDVFPRQRGSQPASTHRFGRLRRDRRLTPLVVAALGVAAVFGSMVVEWGRITLRPSQPDGGPTIDFDAAVTDLGGLGTGYVVGVLGMVCLTALAIFGTATARPNARIAGAASAGGVLVVLVATTSSLDTAARQRFGPIWPDIDVQMIAYGPGLILAYAGTVATGVALYLAHRSAGRSPAAVSRAAPTAAPTTMTDDPATAAVDRRSRPDRSGPDEDVREVTVRTTAPFTRPEWEDRYRP